MFHGTTPFPTVYVRKAADMPVPGAMTRFRPGPSGGVPTPRPMGPPASLGLRSTEPGIGGMWACSPSVSKKSFRHAVRIFKLSKKFKNTCRLNAKGAFCPLHTSPAALSQTSSARFFDSLRRHVGMPPYGVRRGCAATCVGAAISRPKPGGGQSRRSPAGGLLWGINPRACPGA